MTDVDAQEAVVAPGTAPDPDRPSRRAGGIPPSAAFAAALGGAVIVALASAVQLWFAPFVLGLALGGLTGLRRARVQVAVLPTAVASLAGWAIPLLWRAIAGEPVVAAARVIAALAGLPASGWLIIAGTLLVAVSQGLLGVWLSRSVSGPIAARRWPS